MKKENVITNTIVEEFKKVGISVDVERLNESDGAVTYLEKKAMNAVRASENAEGSLSIFEQSYVDDFLDYLQEMTDLAISDVEKFASYFNVPSEETGKMMVNVKLQNGKMALEQPNLRMLDKFRTEMENGKINEEQIETIVGNSANLLSRVLGKEMDCTKQIHMIFHEARLNNPHFIVYP